MRKSRHKLLYRLGTGGLSLVVATLALGGIVFGATGPKAAPTVPVAVPYPAHQIFPPDNDTPTTAATTPPPANEQPPNKPPPQYKPPPPPPKVVGGHVASTPNEAVNAAVAAGRARGERVAVAVLDRFNGTFYAGGDVDSSYASASVMKVFIATRLLVEGRSADPTVEAQMWNMIVASDDNAARTLYRLVGTESLIPWIVNRYGIGGLAPANVPNYWGLTRITARAIVNFYAAVSKDGAVASWLMNAMANARSTAQDGFHQYFGIPSAASQWRVKQGWMCCLENLTRMHSTGYIGGDRYAVALLTEGSTSVYGNYGAQTLTLMARALLPNGSFPVGAPPPPPPPPTTNPPTSPTPTHTPTPAPTTPPPPTATATAPPE